MVGRDTRRRRNWRLPGPEPLAVIRTFFAPDHIHVRPRTVSDGAWSLELALTGAGYEGDVLPAEEPVLAVRGNRAEYRRGDLVEWYVNDERGLEQGFTLASPPGSLARPADGRPLRLEFDVRSELLPTLIDDSHVALRKVDGMPVLHLTKLLAFDADRKTLPARFVLDGEDLAILVDDTDARYPVTIDPLVGREEAKLVASVSDVGATDHFGYSVALDGNTIFVGAPRNDAAYVFQRVGQNWHPQARLVAGDSNGTVQFGEDVALVFASAFSSGQDFAFASTEATTAASESRAAASVAPMRAPTGHSFFRLLIWDASRFWSAGLIALASAAEDFQLTSNVVISLATGHSWSFAGPSANATTPRTRGGRRRS